MSLATLNTYKLVPSAEPREALKEALAYSRVLEEVWARIDASWVLFELNEEDANEDGGEVVVKAVGLFEAAALVVEALVQNVANCRCIVHSALSRSTDTALRKAPCPVTFVQAEALMVVDVADAPLLGRAMRFGSSMLGDLFVCGKSDGISLEEASPAAIVSICDEPLIVGCTIDDATAYLLALAPELDPRKNTVLSRKRDPAMDGER